MITINNYSEKLNNYSNLEYGEKEELCNIISQNDDFSYNAISKIQNFYLSRKIKKNYEYVMNNLNNILYDFLTVKNVRKYSYLKTFINCLDIDTKNDILKTDYLFKTFPELRTNIIDFAFKDENAILNLLKVEDIINYYSEAFLNKLFSSNRKLNKDNYFLDIISYIDYLYYYATYFYKITQTNKNIRIFDLVKSFIDKDIYFTLYLTNYYVYATQFSFKLDDERIELLKYVYTNEYIVNFIIKNPSIIDNFDRNNSITFDKNKYLEILFNENFANLKYKDIENINNIAKNDKEDYIFIFIKSYLFNYILINDYNNFLDKDNYKSKRLINNNVITSHEEIIKYFIGKLNIKNDPNDFIEISKEYFNSYNLFVDKWGGSIFVSKINRILRFVKIFEYYLPCESTKIIFNEFINFISSDRDFINYANAFNIYIEFKSYLDFNNYYNLAIFDIKIIEEYIKNKDLSDNDILYIINNILSNKKENDKIESFDSYFNNFYNELSPKWQDKIGHSYVINNDLKNINIIKNPSKEDYEYVLTMIDNM